MNNSEDVHCGATDAAKDTKAKESDSSEYRSLEEPSNPTSQRRVKLADEKNNDAADAKTEPGRRRFLFHRGPAKTDLDLAPVQSAPDTHKYVVRRPRPLQFIYHGRVVEVGDDGDADIDLEEIRRGRSIERGEDQSSNDISRQSSLADAESRSTDDIDRQRERLELFVDLLFVGIISNISDHYFTQVYKNGQNAGAAFGEFILLFAPSFRIWSNLQVFLNSYWLDDIIQRWFIFWILVLGLVYGNNVPFFLETTDGSHYLIAVFLVAIVSIHIMEIIYSIWIPWIRRAMLVWFFTAIPLMGIWIAATIATNLTQIGLIIAALAYDYMLQIIMLSPLGERILGKAFRKHREQKHTIKRFENFFTIALGEGVILLVRQSPFGQGFHIQLGRGLLVFQLYYALNYMFYHLDQSKRFIHALYRRWYIRSTWLYLHVPLYASLVLTSNGMLYLIGYIPGSASTGTSGNGKRATGDSSQYTLRVATISVCAALATSLFVLTLLGLLNRPLDPPGTLLVSNRYIRLAPRMISIVICATIWLHDFENPTNLLGILSSIVAFIVAWEWTCSMEKDWKWIEPKRERVWDREFSRDGNSNHHQLFHSRSK